MRLVRPVRLTGAARPSSGTASVQISSEIFLSLEEPSSQMAKSRSPKSFARLAKCLAGHCFAGPNSAPGQSATTGRPSSAIPSFAAATRAFSGLARRAGGVRDRRRLAALRGKADEPVNGAHDLLLVEPAAIVENAVAHFTDIAAPSWNSGEEWHERRLERARQHDGEIIAFATEPAPEAPAATEIEAAVRHVDLARLRQPGHPRSKRRGPGRRRQIDDRLRLAGAERGDEALRHDHVADPGGRNDEDAAHRASIARRAGKFNRNKSRASRKGLRLAAGIPPRNGKASYPKGGGWGPPPQRSAALIASIAALPGQSSAVPSVLSGSSTVFMRSLRSPALPLT